MDEISILAGSVRAQAAEELHGFQQV